MVDITIHSAVPVPEGIQDVNGVLFVKCAGFSVPGDCPPIHWKCKQCREPIPNGYIYYAVLRGDKKRYWAGDLFCPACFEKEQD